MTGRIATAVVLIAAAGASADTIKAKFTSSLSKDATITSPTYSGGDASNVKTVFYHWTRQDTPGPGVNSSIPKTFNTYCVDLAQSVSAGTNYTFEVRTPAQHGYSANQTDILGKLWGGFFGLIDTSTESAAFQLAVWETVFDSDGALSTGSFKASSPSSAISLAQTWLDTVKAPGYSGPVAELVVLHSPTAQDQITVIPTPGSMALLGLACMVIGRRRR